MKHLNAILYKPEVRCEVDVLDAVAVNCFPRAAVRSTGCIVAGKFN